MSGVSEIFAVCSALSSETGSPFMVILFPALAVAVGLVAKTLLELTHFPLPYTVVILVAGGVLGVAGCYLDLAELSASAAYWLSINPPEVLLFVFLPPLIFEGALKIDWFVFQRQVWDVLLLAFVLVVLDTILLAVLTVYVLDINWTIDAGIMFGALLAATDPVACVSLLKESGASPSLRTLIEGESLFNDGSAYTLFYLFMKKMQPGTSSGIGVIVVDIIKESLGGFGVGLATAATAIFIIRFVFKDPEVEISTTIVVSFLSFYIAQGPAGVSGAIAVVTSGLLFAADRLSRFSAEALKGLSYFWEVLAFVANTIVFFYSGFLSVVNMIAYWSDGLSGRDIAYIVVFYLLLNVLRALGIALLSPILMHTGYKPGWRELSLVSFSGLRGAVALILAQIVTHQSYLFKLPGNIVPRVSVWTSGIVLLSLVVNGSTYRLVCEKLGLLKLSDARLALFEQAKRKVIDSDWNMFHSLSNSSRYSGADWTFVRVFVDPEVANDEKKLKHTLKHLNEYNSRMESNTVTRHLPSEENPSIEELESISNTPEVDTDKSVNIGKDSYADVTKKEHSYVIPSSERQYITNNNLSPRLSLLEETKRLGRKTPAVNRLIELHHLESEETESIALSSVQRLEPGLNKSAVYEGEGFSFEIRKRVLRALRSQVSQQRLRGFISANAYRTLRAAIDKGLDTLSLPLHVFVDLEKYGWGLSKLERFFIELFGRSSFTRFVSRRFLYRRYSIGCSIIASLWSSLIFVKRHVDIGGSVVAEVEREVRLCISYLRAILAHRIHIIEKLYESGELDEAEFSFLVNETNMRQRRLTKIPIRFAQTKAREVVGDLLFVRNAPDSHFQDDVISLGKLRVFGIGIKILSLGIVSPGVFVLLRGLVHLRTVDDDTIAYSRASVETFERNETTSPFGHVGSIFGLASCLFSMPLPKSVIVVSPFAHFLFLSTTDLERLILVYPNCKIDLYRMAALELVNLLCPEAAQVLDEDDDIDSREWKFREFDEEFGSNVMSYVEHADFSQQRDNMASNNDPVSERDIAESIETQNCDFPQGFVDEKKVKPYSETDTMKVVGLDLISDKKLYSIRYAAFLLRHLSGSQIVRYSWGQLVVSHIRQTERSAVTMICGILLTGILVKVTSDKETLAGKDEITAPALIRDKSGVLTVKSDFAILAIV
ncbi:Sodium/hydrogen exchanger 7 [Galdieria sulphuraria]|nr:Sodium/hydrogen exchanger 7 [Galdieria sulphuraria]